MNSPSNCSLPPAPLYFQPCQLAAKVAALSRSSLSTRVHCRCWHVAEQRTSASQMTLRGRDCEAETASAVGGVQVPCILDLPRAAGIGKKMPPQRPGPLAAYRSDRLSPALELPRASTRLGKKLIRDFQILLLFFLS